MAKVIQADREAAAQLYEHFSDRRLKKNSGRIRAGECDDWWVVRIVAEFREASTAQLLADLAIASSAFAEVQALVRYAFDGTLYAPQALDAIDDVVTKALSRIQGQGEYTCGGGE